MVKRLFDIAFACGWLLAFAPLLAAVAILVRLKLGTPVLFRQERPGRAGVPFKVVKFRTMTDAVDAAGKLLPDDARLTTFGKFLRTTTLDEFPQMWNVFVGDMSVVGPRPLLMRYLPRYNAFQTQRMLVKPGVTGWAQVNGRNALSWEEKFALDVWYVQNQSLWLDLRIVVKTLFVVFGRRNVNSTNAATMEEFLGNDLPRPP